MQKPRDGRGRPRGSGAYPRLVQTHLPTRYFDRLMAFAQTMAMTRSEALRYLVGTLPAVQDEALTGVDGRTVSIGAPGPQVGG
jgi:hypothetical protein